MPSNTKSIKKDVDNKSIPQYFNETADEFQELNGRNGANFVELQKADGTAMELENIMNNLATEVKLEAVRILLNSLKGLF